VTSIGLLLRPAAALALSLLVFAPAASATPVTITFDELPAQPVDGVSLFGLGFGFQVDGVDSDLAVFGAPAIDLQPYVVGPVLEGPPGILTLDFAIPTRVIDFGLLVPVGPSGAFLEVELFDESSSSLGVESLPIESFSGSGSAYSYDGTRVSRAVITVPDAPAFFWLDNLTFIDVPETTVEDVGAAGVGGSAGADGDPATSGGAGGDGQPALADARSPNPGDHAVATAGAGGAGGAGGDGGVGDGGSGGDGGRGGDASGVSVSDAASTSAFADSVATGGIGGIGGVGGRAGTGGVQGARGSGGAGGDASASASASSDAGSATAIATASGAHGSTGARGGDGGSASGSAQAVSLAGADAVASLTATGGIGGSGSDGAGGGDGGDGASVALVDAVTGSTTGTLSLEQIARGGTGGHRFGSGRGGSGGDAISSLQHAGSAAALSLRVEAYGGFALDPGAERAGAAAADADATNDAGEVEVVVLSRSGRSEFSDTALQDATATAAGTSFGDGHGVNVQSTAIGGGFGGSVSDPTPGGSATSAATGIAHGDSLVAVASDAQGGGRGGNAASTAHASNAGPSAVAASADATGGFGGRAVPGEDAHAGGDAVAEARAGSSGGGDVVADTMAVAGLAGIGGPSGVGGRAFATAVGESTGSGAVAAHAEAHGGNEGNCCFGVPQLNGLGGDASASAEAWGDADVDASAVARPGTSYGTRVTGLGTARAFGSGASGSVTARAITGALDTVAPNRGLETLASAPVAGEAAVEARVRYVGSLSEKPSEPLAAWIHATGAPEPGDLLGPPAELGLSPSAVVVAGAVGLHPDGVPGSDSGHAEVTLALEVDALPPNSALSATFFDSEITGAFDELRVTASRRNTILWQVIFTDAAAALAFFASGPIALAYTESFEPSHSYRVSFDLAAATPGAAFGTGFALAILPEPSTRLLIATALVVGARRGTRRARSAR